MREWWKWTSPSVGAWAVILLAVGSAACGPDKKICGSGLTNCGGICVDLQNDPLFCGTCTKTCPVGASCSSGSCLCPAGKQDVCGSGRGVCVDKQTDPKNCGVCSHDCGLGTCSAGGCACGASVDCTPTASPQCVDTQSDPLNCGKCGQLCGLGSCSTGSCVCSTSAGVALCSGASPECVNTQTDSSHCGGCNVQCTAGQHCSFAKCCPTAQTNCGGSCVDTSSDPSHCGKCTTTCTAGEHCSNAKCCQSSQTNCGGTCVDTSSDPNHCGACGKGCEAGKSCSGGKCQCSASKLQCGSSCCDGNACCGSQCQTQHTNGLGGTFYDCQPLGSYSIGSAMAAAASWDGNARVSDYSSICGGNGGLASCLAAVAQSGNGCAVWCYAGTYAGRVRLEGNSALCICPTDLNQNWQ